MERWSLRLWGQVQGVNLRWQVQEYALQNNLTGWIKNEKDGSVLIELQGPKINLNDFVKWLQTRARFVKVGTMQTNKLNTMPDNEFVIKN